MSQLILRGIPIKNKIRDDLKKEVALLSEASGIIPRMGILLIGNNPRSEVYIKKKITFAEESGILADIHRLPEDCPFDVAAKTVQSLSKDEAIHGILIQMPLPEQFSKEDTQRLMDLIPLSKDIDGLTTQNIEMLGNDFDKAILPATARAVNLLLSGYEIPIKDKKIIVIGRSNLVGRPTALALAHQGGKVTVCHSETLNIPEKARMADILVVATGVPYLITPDFTNPNQTIIDVGISVLDGGKIVGDVDFENVAPLVHAISPAPGGVGPLTVAGLFLNVIEACRKQIRR